MLACVRVCIRDSSKLPHLSTPPFFFNEKKGASSNHYVNETFYRAYPFEVSLNLKSRSPLTLTVPLPSPFLNSRSPLTLVVRLSQGESLKRRTAFALGLDKSLKSRPNASALEETRVMARSEVCFS